MKIFTDRLREARKRAGYSQAEMAEYLQSSRQAYTHYETGYREPSIEALAKIIKKLNCSADYLLGFSDSPEPIVPSQASNEALAEYKKTAPIYKVTDEQLAAALPADIREGMMALIRMELEKQKDKQEKEDQ